MLTIKEYRAHLRTVSDEELRATKDQLSLSEMLTKTWEQRWDAVNRELKRRAI